MFLVPARIIFWGRLDLFFIFYFHKLRKKNLKNKKFSENPTEIKQRGKQTHYFVLWTAVHYSVLIIFPLHSQKCEKKIHQITQENTMNKKKIGCILLYIFRILHPKLLIYLNFRSLNIYKYVNMIHIFKAF